MSKLTAHQHNKGNQLALNVSHSNMIRIAKNLWQNSVQIAAHKLLPASCVTLTLAMFSCHGVGDRDFTDDLLGIDVLSKFAVLDDQSLIFVNDLKVSTELGALCTFSEGDTIAIAKHENTGSIHLTSEKPLSQCSDNTSEFSLADHEIYVGDYENFVSVHAQKIGELDDPYQNNHMIIGEDVLQAGHHLNGDKQMFFPLQKSPLDRYHTSGRGFGATRNGGRRHAANDLLEHKGSPVHAVTDGVIIDYYWFYQGTRAIVIDHDNFIVRYGEIDRFWDHNVRLGSKVTAGQKIAGIGQLWHGSSMLHFEKYSGKLKGALTVLANYPYKRRRDLVDPTRFLISLEGNHPHHH
ncbi:MAG: M23 family metallopeptidase [Proteobacteria bacterium]|nr:M23 family metallopeptidase [Pseudomonadota bacterium]